MAAAVSADVRKSTSSSALPSSGPTSAPAAANTLNRANASAFRPSASWARYVRTAGLNSAPAKPLSADAASSTTRSCPNANNPNPRVRSPHPAMMTPRAPSRSAAEPPTTNNPC